jgi:hypothetical protein
MIVNNETRADWARDAVLAFRKHAGGSTSEDGKTPDYGESIGDLIADLLHLCDVEGVDPFDAVSNGVSQYTCEKLDPPDGMSHEASVNIEVKAKRYGQPGEPWMPYTTN